VRSLNGRYRPNQLPAIRSGMNAEPAAGPDKVTAYYRGHDSARRKALQIRTLVARRERYREMMQEQRRRESLMTGV